MNFIDRIKIKLLINKLKKHDWIVYEIDSNKENVLFVKFIQNDYSSPIKFLQKFVPMKYWIEIKKVLHPYLKYTKNVETIIFWSFESRTSKRYQYIRTPLDQIIEHLEK